MTVKMLQISGVGRAVNRCSSRNSAEPEVAVESRALVDHWRRLCRMGQDDHRCGRDSESKWQRAADCAEQLENAIWLATHGCKITEEQEQLREARRDYLHRVRSLMTILRRSGSGRFRCEILDGTLSAQEVLRMAPEDFLSQEERALREQE